MLVLDQTLPQRSPPLARVMVKARTIRGGCLTVGAVVIGSMQGKRGKTTFTHALTGVQPMTFTAQEAGSGAEPGRMQVVLTQELLAAERALICSARRVLWMLHPVGYRYLV